MSNKLKLKLKLCCRFGIERDGDNYDLIIKSATETLAGTYRCWTVVADSKAFAEVVVLGSHSFLIHSLSGNQF
jgi:hypothetical protein